MPSLPVREESRSEPMQERVQPPVNPSSFVIQMQPNLERVMVDVIMDDYQKASQDRRSREYGSTAKGDKFTFETWLKDVERLY